MKGRGKLLQEIVVNRCGLSLFRVRSLVTLGDDDRPRAGKLLNAEV